MGPYPTDLYNPTGGKLTVPVKVTTPLANALNTLDGFSTTAVITAPFNAPVDPASLVPFNPQVPATALTASIYVLDVTHGAPLVPGLHYTVRVSSAAGGESLVEIVPLHPARARAHATRSS